MNRTGWSLSMVVLACLCFTSCTKNQPTVATPHPPVASTPGTQAPPTPVSVAETPESAPQVPPPQVVRLPGDKTPAVTKVLALFDRLRTLQQSPSPAAATSRFSLSDQEVNEYLAWSLSTHRRPGITAATVHFKAENNIQVFVEIDFNTFIDWDTYRLPSFLRPALVAARTVRADTHFESGEHSVHLAVTKSYGPQGREIPANIMEAIIQAIALEQPEVYNTGVPLKLPFGLNRIWTADGSFSGEM